MVQQSASTGKGFTQKSDISSQKSVDPGNRTQFTYFRESTKQCTQG